MSKKRLRFVCSECGEDELEEIMTDIVLWSAVDSVELSEREGHCHPQIVYADEGDPRDSGSIRRYQCASCGASLKRPDGNEITDIADLLSWLEQHGTLEEEEA